MKKLLTHRIWNPLRLKKRRSRILKKTCVESDEKGPSLTAKRARFDYKQKNLMLYNIYDYIILIFSKCKFFVYTL